MSDSITEGNWDFLFQIVEAKYESIPAGLYSDRVSAVVNR